MDADEPAPHCDPARFDEVIASITPESILVVIERAMGETVRRWCGPEDVWQETLVCAWRDREQHRWEGPRAYRSWVITIAKNRIRDIARGLSREKRGGGEAPVLLSALAPSDGGSIASLLPAGSTTPSRVAGHLEQSRLLAASLDSLDDDVRDVVRLHLFEDRRMEDVARELGLSIDTAWRRFRKGAAAYARKLQSLRTQAGGAAGSP